MIVFPLSLHVSRDGEDADLMDNEGNLIAEFVDADEGRQVMALIEKGRSVYRQADNYDLDPADLIRLDRRIAEMAGDWSGPVSFAPADAATDGPTD